MGKGWEGVRVCSGSTCTRNHENRDPKTTGLPKPVSRLIPHQSSCSLVDLQSKITSPSQANDQAMPNSTCDNAPNPQKTYLAIAGSRPPNPSLVVDLGVLKITDHNHPQPETICESLNKELSETSPTHIKLATVRWTAKGNLVITGAPSTTASSLQAAAPHISSILTKTLHLPPNTPLPPSVSVAGSAEPSRS